MKRWTLVLLTGLALIVAGCSSDSSSSDDNSSTVPAAPSVSEQTATTEPTGVGQLKEWPTALTLGAVLTHRGFECVDSQNLPALAPSLSEDRAGCTTNTATGGAYIFLSTFDSAEQMERALALRAYGSSMQTGADESAFVSGANWIVECQDGGPGGPGQAVCTKVQSVLGGDLL